MRGLVDEGRPMGQEKGPRGSEGETRRKEIRGTRWAIAASCPAAIGRRDTSQCRQEACGVGVIFPKREVLSSWQCLDGAVAIAPSKYANVVKVFEEVDIIFILQALSIYTIQFGVSTLYIQLLDAINPSAVNK